MKLIDLLSIMDDLSEVVIWEDGVPEDEGPAYEGCALEVPWYLAKAELSPIINNGECSLSVRTYETGKAIMVIGIASTTSDSNKESYPMNLPEVDKK